METRANYLLVGGFVLVLAAGLVAFVLWLAKTHYEAGVTRYDIYFVGPVTGLKKGSAVSYRGLTVGEVVDLKIDPTNVERVLVTIEVQADTPVRTDTVASLEIQGIAGVPFILLSGGTQKAPPLTAKEGQRYPVIVSVPSRIERVLADAPALVERVNLLLVRANEVLNVENRAALANILKNLDTVSTTVAGRSDEIDRAIADVSATMSNLREAAGALERLAENMNGATDRLAAHADETLAAIGRTASTVDRSVANVGSELQPLLADLRKTSRSLAAMADEIDAMVAENREPLRQFTGTALTDLVAFLAEARQLMTALRRVTTEVERDPARFLFGDQQQGYDVSKPEP